MTGNAWNSINGPTNTAVFTNTSGSIQVINPITIGGLTYSPAGTFLIWGSTINLGATSIFNVANAASALTVSNVIAGSFGLTKSGSGTLILTGSNSYTGTTTVNTTGGVSGALQLGNGGTTGSLAGNGTISLGGQVFFRINRSDSVTQGVDFGIISGFANGSGFTYGIIQAGTGTTTLMVNTNFNRVGGVEGIFGVTAGTLRLGTNQAINETGQVTSSLGNSLRVQGGTLDIGTFTNNVRNLYVTNGNAIGNGMLNVFGQIALGGNGATSLISANLGGAATLGQSAFGSTFILTGSNSYTGITSLFNNSTLNIQNNSALGSTSAGTTVNSSTELQLEGGITVGSETLTLDGTGRSSGGALRNISGTNTYGGPIILGANSRINSDTNLLILTGGITGAAQALTVGGSGNTTMNSAIATTTGTLTKDGTGILTLSGNNTYTGNTTVTAGTLRVGNNSALGTGTLVFNGGALSASDSVTARTLTNNFIVGANISLGDIVNNAALTFNGRGNLGTTTRTLTINSAVTFAGALTNTAGITKNGAGTLTLSSSNSYSGGTLISAGALQLNGTNSGSGAITVSGGIFGGTGRASNSAVSMSGGAMTPGDGSSVGTLSIGSLSITGGTLNILLGGSSTSLLAVNGNATLGGALNFSTNAVLTNSTYTFLTFTGSLSETFSTTNALPTGYQLVYGSNSVYLQALAGLGPITTTFGGGTNAIITGGITNFLVGVTNTAADGSANMVFTATNASNTTGSIGSTTLTPQSGTNVGGLGYNGTNVGLNQIGTVTVSSTNATPSSGTGTVTVDVYDHAAGSLTNNSVAFSDVIVGFGGTNLTANIGVTNSNGFRVNLQAIGISTNTNLTLGNIASLTNGAVTNGVLILGTNQGVGAFTNTVDYTFGDASSLAGANTNLSTTNVTVTGAVYDHAQGSLSSSNVSFRVHVGYAAPQTTNVGVSNAAGFRVSLITLATNSSNNLSLGSVSNVATNSSSNAILTLATGLGAGAFTNVIGVVYGDDSTLAGASSTVGTNFLTVSGLVYTGQSVWTTNSGNWTNFDNWSALGGTPGLDGSLSTNDMATFGSGSGGIVTLNTNAALNALSFSNASAYTVAGTGTISLVEGSNAPSITTALGSHTISNALSFATNVTVNNAASTMLTLAGSITGAGGLTKTGAGTAIVSGNNSYSGSTSLNAGRLVTASTNALGSGPVSLTGGTLALASNLTLSSLVWNSAAEISLPEVNSSNYLTVTGSAALTGSGTNRFNLSGVTLTTNPVQLFNFGTNSFTTNQFALTGVRYYELSITNNSLWAYNPVLICPTGIPVMVTNSMTYQLVVFDPYSTLNITPSGNLTITSAMTVSNNSMVILNGVLTTPSLTVDLGSSLMGSGSLSLTGGKLTVNGTFAPGNGLGTFFVSGGNLVMGASSVWDQQIYSASVYDRVVVTGSTILNGTMNITTFGSGGLQIGQKYNFLTASGGISGAFSSIIAPEGFRGRLLLSGNNTQANMLIAPTSYTQLAANRNQSNVATALNSFIPYTSGDQQLVSTSLDSLTASQYNQAFNAIMPAFYQQIATIAFNNANAQNMQLVQRLWGLRVAEGGGFSMSGLADNIPILEGQGDGSTGKGVLDSKKDILRPGLDNHWGMFVDGNGIFAQANSGNMLPGYNSQSGGVTTGLTYKWNENVGTGIYCGYQGTYTKSGADGSGLGTGSRLIDNAVRFGVFGTYGQKDGKGLFVNALAGGGYHNFQATRVIQYAGMNRTANSAPGAGELDTMLAAGYDIKKDKFTFGPTASLQYTYLGVNSLNETGAQSLSFNSGGWNSSSMLSSVGAHAAYSWVASKNILVVPQVNLSWQHEFLQNPYNITGNLGGTSPTFSNTSATGIRDYLYTGVGFTVELNKKWNTSFFYNAAAGNSDLVSQNIFWSVGVKF